MTVKVVLTKTAKKALRKTPHFILKKLYFWVTSVMEVGLEETKKAKGFHDESLKGKRKGQRSIRLNKDYRCIYRVGSGKVEVLEINKHEY